ncbi:MAG: HAMP domain-containing histidine kinase [Actinobacteria bacterium]|nr:MAG: HAMP domain-containing histidine kinase [Actinomycetota bacterium]
MAWGIAIAALVTGLAAGLMLGARSRARVGRLRHGVRELASGNLGHRIILPGRDDAAAIAEDLNQLADDLQTERQATQAREASRRRLLANISHDLRTPVASIGGYVDALQRGLGDDPTRYLAVIATKTDELAELTDDLFYEARLDSGDLVLASTPVDLAEAARRAILGFEPQLTARGVRVDVAIPEEACVVEADGLAVTRILGNLVSNAIRHGERMTTMTVEVTCDGTRREVRLTNDGAALPADVERLFERGVAGAGGAGLGLAIARELAHRMGAAVLAERLADDKVSFALTFRES